MTLGANLLEVHVVFSRECFGPDVKASVTTAELAQLVEGVRFIERALAHPLDKQQVAGEMTRTQTDVRQERRGRPRSAGAASGWNEPTWRSRNPAPAFRPRG